MRFRNRSEDELPLEPELATYVPPICGLWIESPQVKTVLDHDYVAGIATVDVHERISHLSRWSDNHVRQAPRHEPIYLEQQAPVVERDLVRMVSSEDAELDAS